MKCLVSEAEELSGCLITGYLGGGPGNGNMIYGHIFTIQLSFLLFICK